MVSAKVISAFYDKKDPNRKVYNPGDTFNGEAGRVAELAEKGFVKVAERVEEKPQSKVKQKNKK